VASPEARPAFTREYGGHPIEFLPLHRLVQEIRAA